MPGIDLGTTNVVGVLLDLAKGEPVGELSEVNPQIAHGEDILNRIHFCLKKGNLEELQRQAAGCINSIALRLAEAAGITVFCVVIFLKGLGVPLPILGSWFGN